MKNILISCFCGLGSLHKEAVILYSLGIDIGYSSIKLVLIDSDLKVLENHYILHKGRVKEELNKNINSLIEKYGEMITFGGFTGQGSKSLSTDSEFSWINEVTSLVRGGKSFDKNIDSIIEIGGQSSKYITNISDEKSSPIKISINSNCSAGTGSFIEEQVSRLGINLEDYSTLAEAATSIPRIAGRCSVFAKTDIIHHQQEGVNVNDMLLGLAYSLVKNYKATVVKKSDIGETVLIAGGVAYNKAIIKALKDTLNLDEKNIIIPENCSNIAALGAAIISIEDSLHINLNKLGNILKADDALKETKEKISLAPLYIDGKNNSLNKHICKDTKHIDYVQGYIGLDIGSTSTNVVLMDELGEVLSFKYLRTKGDPIGAVQKGLREIKKDIDKEIKVLGVGATGSGRYMAGSFAGADVIKDEITAQARAALFLDKDVDTIIEIGGQDSKFIKLEDGVVSDFEMNKICAAGTGSFIEEQAKKLDIEIEKFGDIALKSENPVDLGDRCTVFIETNIAQSLSQGDKIEDISSGLAYSIAKNYLNKVVGNKEIGSKVFFQGGVAYNQAVINAFRNILGDKIYVPKFFSVTGAYGAAILAQEEMQGKASDFRGFDLDREFDFKSLKKKTKNQENKRTKVFEEIERYYLHGYKGRTNAEKKTIGIPRVLVLQKLFPLFNTYFTELGFDVIISENSSEKTVELSQKFAMEETCYPVKLINGHVAELMDKGVDYIFMPSIYTMAHEVSKTRQNYGCVYMQSWPKLIDKTMGLREKGIKLLTPELSFEFGKKYMMKTLLKLSQELGKNTIQGSIALAKGMKALNTFETKVEKLGEQTIKDLGKDEKAFVIVTRTYGIVDPILNMGIPEKLEKLGYKVLTLSNLPAHDHDTSKEHPNMYWPFGQHILSGAQIIKNHPNLYAIYITNHGCGPDTVVSHYFKEEMKGKPYLNIEVDEHFSSVGVLTRVEAFVNSLKSKIVKNEDAKTLKYYSEQTAHIPTNIKNSISEIDKDATILIPYMYPYSSLFKAYLEASGRKASVLPMTNQKSLDMGRKYTLSKEYLSLTALLGDCIYNLKDKEEKEKYSLLIPATEGSEADGQYSRLIRDKLNKENLSDVDIVSPFAEEIIKNDRISKDTFLVLLLGDIINLANIKDRETFLKEAENLIKAKKLSIDTLKDMALRVKASLSKTVSKKLLATGEVSILFNNFLNNNMLKNLEEKDIKILYQPLSEYMWFLWMDYLKQKKNKEEKTAHTLMDKFKSYIKIISSIFGESSFEENLDELEPRANKDMGLYSGANGRYRYSKLTGNINDINGIINISSMYENTNTIINILHQDTDNDNQIPILNMTFDGNENEIDKSKIDSFVYYVLQDKKNKEDRDKRGA